MFSKLRNKFVLNSVIMSSAVVVLAFSAVFAIAAMRVGRAHVIPNEFGEPGSSEMAKRFEDEIHKERQAQLLSLGLTLVVVGVCVEVAVFVFSYIFAEKAIEPVKQAYDNQREFIANASHELKTPIATVRANFEALGVTEEPWTTNIDTELTRASNLIANLLTLARADGRKKATPSVVEITTVINKRIKLVEARLGEKNLEQKLPKKAEMELVEADFAQILDILLDNAIKYSDKSIEVVFDNKTLSVKNDGKTIPANKLERVFDRFYQTDKTAEGSGLGLSIAKAVADSNGWDLIAESDKKTTTFKLTLS